MLKLNLKLCLFILGALLFGAPLGAFAAGITIPSGSTLNVNTGTLSVGGDVTNAGTLILTTGTVTLSGSWANTGTFTVGTGTVSFTGSSTATISGSTTFYNFTCTAAGKQLTFTAGTTQTVTGALTLTGSSGSRILLRSSSAGSIYTITDSGIEDVSYVNVRDSTAANSIIAFNSIDSGNNTRWVFSGFADLGGNTAVHFDGVDDYVNIPSGYTYTIKGDDTHTISLWMKIEGFNNANQAVIPFTNSTGDVYFQINGSNGVVVWQVGNAYRGYTPGISVDEGGWHNVVMVKTAAGDNGNFYIDGVLQTSYTGTIASTPTTNGDLIIGKYNGSGYEFAGLIDDFRIYNRALSAAEALTNFQAGVEQRYAFTMWLDNEQLGQMWDIDASGAGATCAATVYSGTTSFTTEAAIADASFTKDSATNLCTAAWAPPANLNDMYTVVDTITYFGVTYTNALSLETATPAPDKSETWIIKSSLHFDDPSYAVTVSFAN